VSPCSFCCLRYYWSFYSPPSPLFLVWFWWHSYFLANLLIIILKRFRLYQLYFLCTFLPSSRCSTRISPWTTLIHTLHYCSQLSYICFVCQPSSILLMTLNCSSPFGHLNSSPIVYTYKRQLIASLNGCLQIFSHSINPKLSFFVLTYLLNYLKYLILLFYCLLKSLILQLNLLIILASFSILHSRHLIISPQFLNLASYLFAMFEG